MKNLEYQYMQEYEKEMEEERMAMEVEVREKMGRIREFYVRLWESGVVVYPR